MEADLHVISRGLYVISLYTFIYCIMFCTQLYPKSSLFLSLIGHPDPPRNLEVLDVTSDTVRLSWQPPLHDGGSTITSYVVEKRDGKSEAWARCVTSRNCFHTIVGLKPEADYQFRVTAMNSYGASEPCEASAIIATKRELVKDFSKCLQTS